MARGVARKEESEREAKLQKERDDAAVAKETALASIESKKATELANKKAQAVSAHTSLIHNETVAAALAEEAAVTQVNMQITTSSNAAVSDYNVAAEQKRKDAVVAKVRGAKPVAQPLGLVPIDIDGNGVQNTADAVVLFVAQTMQGYGASMLIRKYWLAHPHGAEAKADLTEILETVDQAVSQQQVAPAAAQYPQPCGLAHRRSLPELPW